VANTFNLYNQLYGPPYNQSVAMTIPQGSFILYTRVKASTPFTGGSLSAMTVSLGKSGSANNFFTQAYNVFQAVADGTLQETFAQPNGQLSSYTPTVTFTPTGDTLAHWHGWRPEHRHRAVPDDHTGSVHRQPDRSQFERALRD